MYISNCRNEFRVANHFTSVLQNFQPRELLKKFIKVNTTRELSINMNKKAKQRQKRTENSFFNRINEPIFSISVWTSAYIVFTMGAHYEIILIELFFLSVKKSDDGCQNMGNCTRFGNRKTKSGALWSMAESISFPPGFLIWLLLRCETTTEPLLLMALLKHTAKSWSFQFTIIDLELSLLVESRESSHALRMRQGSM